MSELIFPNGTKELTLAAADRVSVYSESPFKVYQWVGLPHIPGVWDLLYTGVANELYQSAAFAAGGTVKVECGPAGGYASVGTSASVLEVKNLRKTAVGTLNATGVLTTALIAGGVVTSTTVAAVTATTDTGAEIDAAIDIDIGESFDFSVVNTGGANAITVTAGASGVTVVGLAAVAANTSGTFRVVKTAADTFIIYRV